MFGFCVLKGACLFFACKLEFKKFGLKGKVPGQGEGKTDDRANVKIGVFSYFGVTCGEKKYSAIYLQKKAKPLM